MGGAGAMDKEQTNHRQDRRVARTRGAIVDSFNHLVRERPYESIQVPDILDEAGVGRSTFYEHFRNRMPCSCNPRPSSSTRSQTP